MSGATPSARPKSSTNSSTCFAVKATATATLSCTVTTTEFGQCLVTCTALIQVKADRFFFIVASLRLIIDGWFERPDAARSAAGDSW